MKENIDDLKLKTGTTTVGLVCKDAVVLGADRKATMGYLVASKDAQKVYKIDDNLGMTIAGSVGDAQAIIRYIKAELRLYELNEEKKMAVGSAAALIGNILYSSKWYPYYLQLIVGGYDTKPRVYSLGPDGSVMEEKYFSTGSGSVMAFGVLEEGFSENMVLDDAVKLVAKAIKSA
ncbi:MAG: proteasome subunit beta, partial [Candidatus Micrarchaeota archaeon]|nr:proteasome subunit beta [Candidatus Micrarchaeota archaeon]